MSDKVKLTRDSFADTPLTRGARGVEIVLATPGFGAGVITRHRKPPALERVHRKVLDFTTCS